MQQWFFASNCLTIVSSSSAAERAIQNLAYQFDTLGSRFKSWDGAREVDRQDRDPWRLGMRDPAGHEHHTHIHPGRGMKPGYERDADEDEGEEHNEGDGEHSIKAELAKLKETVSGLAKAVSGIIGVLEKASGAREEDAGAEDEDESGNPALAERIEAQRDPDGRSGITDRQIAAAKMAEDGLLGRFPQAARIGPGVSAMPRKTWPVRMSSAQSADLLKRFPNADRVLK